MAENRKLQVVLEAMTFGRIVINTTKDATVAVIKETALNKLRIDESHLKLMFAGRVLDLKSTRTLDELGMKDPSNVMVFIRVPGGGGLMPNKEQKHQGQSSGDHVFQIAQNFINGIKLPEGYFDPKYNICFCEVCHLKRKDNLVYLRGTPPRTYGLPIGWCKFGLRTPSRADVIGIFDKWHVAFHGTRVESVEKILKTGELLIPGDKTPSGEVLPIPKNHWDPNHPNPKMRPPPGHDVKMFYFSPSIKYSGCDVYAPLHKFNDPTSDRTHKIRVAFQVRIEPETYNVGAQTIGAQGTIDQLFPNKELEWSTDRRGVAILVGLLVKVEDIVGKSISIGINENQDVSKQQKGIEASKMYPATFRFDYNHEAVGGNEIKIRKGESCMVLHQDGNQLQVIHSRINEPFLIPKHYVRY